MAAEARFTFTDLQNPLFLHPSDGPTSVSVPKLQGAGDYRAWRRSIEIQFSAKRKLGFVDGTTIRGTDATEAAQWDICNNIVISWLHSNISENIKKSVLFITTAAEIWKQLEKRFSLTNGSRKYKLTRDLFNLTQNGRSINDYFTEMSALWEEIESMNLLPTVASPTLEVNKLLETIARIREESQLFQFLNWLDDVFSAQRSQLLMLIPLPYVEVACSAIQQEESQRDVLKTGFSPDVEMSAMFSKGNAIKKYQCNTCGKKGALYR